MPAIRLARTGRARRGGTGTIDILRAARSIGSEPSLSELPGGVESALAVQLDVLESFKNIGRRQAGWKVGLTSGAARNMMGESVRPFGYILADRTFQSGATLHEAPRLQAQLEPELCLMMGRALHGSGLTPATCREAVAETRAAFELNEVRVPQARGMNLFVADGLANWGLVVGSGAPLREPFVLPKVSLYRDDVKLGETDASLVMDDPFLSLSRLCEGLARHGRGLQPGDLVITGSFLRAPIDRSARYRATFEGLGEVEVGFE